MLDVRSHTLRNGCKILVRPTPDKQILSLVAAIPWGGRDDDPSLAGRSNLMARLFTKGTTSRTSLQIAETLESVGGDIDSFCGHDLLGLETQTVEADWQIAIDVLSDCLFHPTFEPYEFEKEQSLVKAEILRSEDEKFAFTYKQFQGLLYQGHPYQLPPDGTVESVDSISRDAVRELHAAMARPDQVLLCVVGNVPDDELIAWIEEHWPAAPKTPAPPRTLPLAPPGKGQGGAITLAKEIEQAFVVVGYIAPPIDSPEYAALRVACGVLGEGMSARLFSRLRDRDHLAYAVGSMLVGRQLATHMSLYIGTNPENVSRAREGMIREALGIATEELTEQEVDRAKRYILGKYLMSRQTNSALAHSMSTHETIGLGWEWGEHLAERIHAVTLDAVREAARRYLVNPATATLEPEKR